MGARVSHRLGATVGATVSALALMTSSSTALAARVAVVPAVDVHVDDAVAAAAAVRAALENEADAVVQTREETALALRGPAGAPVDVSRARGIAKDADVAFEALEHERSVALLEEAIASLENDRDFSSEKRALLEELRLRCAQRLIGLAGPSETGNAETKQGQAARRHLQQALRANPRLELTKVPPKVRALAELAAGDVNKLGLGGLQVTSTPTGATVLLDARPVGVTPLSTTTASAPGTYRLWVELPTSDASRPAPRSFARSVTLEAGQVLEANIDAGFEAALRADVGGVAPSSPWRAAELARLATVLGVDDVVVVGVDDDAQAPAWLLRFTGQGLQRVTFARAAVDAVPAALPSLSASTSTTLSPPVPAAFYVDDAAVAGAGVVDDDGFPWLWVGAGVAGAVVVAAGAVAVGVAVAPPTRTLTVNVGVR